MLACQIAYLAKLKEGRTTEATESAKRNDAASHAKLNKLRALPVNSKCFDCSAMRPGWAVLPHGIFVCIDCAQTHRNLGRHISQTKAINTGTYLWFPHELKVMEEVGNGVAEAAFHAMSEKLPPRPANGASPAEWLAYVKAKYAGGVCAPDFCAASAVKCKPSAPAIDKIVFRSPTCSSFNRATTARPALKGAIRTQVPSDDHHQSVATATAPEADLISFDEPALLPNGIKPFTKTADESEAFFASFGL